jgi:hypothetical protein
MPSSPAVPMPPLSITRPPCLGSPPAPSSPSSPPRSPPRSPRSPGGSSHTTEVNEAVPVFSRGPESRRTLEAAPSDATLGKAGAVDPAADAHAPHADPPVLRRPGTDSKETISASKETISASKETISASKETISASKETISADDGAGEAVEPTSLPPVAHRAEDAGSEEGGVDLAHLAALEELAEVVSSRARSAGAEGADAEGAAELDEGEEALLTRFLAGDTSAMRAPTSFEEAEGVELDARSEASELDAAITVELQPEVAILYLQQLLALGMVHAPLPESDLHGEMLQVPIESYLQLETEPPWSDHADERVQIVHKLLLDLLNAALRYEAMRLYRSRAPRVGRGTTAAAGGGSSAETLPRGAWCELPRGELALQRMVEAACQQVVAWLVEAHKAEGVSIEVRLSQLLEADTADIERAWQDVASHKEDVIAEVSECILAEMIREFEGWPQCADLPVIA